MVRRLEWLRASSLSPRALRQKRLYLTLRAKRTSKGKIFHSKHFRQNSDTLQTGKSVTVLGGSKFAWDAVYAYATAGVHVNWVIRCEYSRDGSMPVDMLLTTGEQHPDTAHAGWHLHMSPRSRNGSRNSQVSETATNYLSALRVSDPALSSRYTFLDLVQPPHMGPRRWLPRHTQVPSRHFCR